MEDKYNLSAKDQWIVLKRLLKYADKYRFLLLTAIFFLFVTTLVQALIPQVAKYFIDNYIGEIFTSQKIIIFILCGYYILYLLQAFFNYLGRLTFYKVSYLVIKDLRSDAFSNIQKLSMSYFDKTASGSIVSRVTNDTESISRMFEVIFTGFIKGMFLIFISIYSIFLLNLQLGFFILLLMPIVFLCIYFYRKFSVVLVSKTRSKLSEINSKLAESIESMRIIQAFSQEKRLAEDFEKTNTEHYLYFIKYLKVDSLLLRPALALLKLLAYTIVLAYFGFRGVELGITAGAMYAFIQYINRLFDPLIELTQSFAILQSSVVSGHRVFMVIDNDEYEPRQNNKNFKINNGDIEFKNVSFSYDGKKDVLKNISFKVNKGETIAFVGHTGSGKSSIINLFMRFYEFDRGDIYIDGYNIKDFSRKELFTNVGLVLQDPFLYHGNIKDNIKLFAKNLTDDDVEEAAKFVDADDFIEKLENKYNHKVTERGSTFSCGQRQLLAFARTMALKPKILILDEATASIDTETEEIIQNSLNKMRRGRTTIAIAHRLSTIQDANCIYVLDKGEIVESGTHEELLKNKSLYYKMYELQTKLN